MQILKHQKCLYHIKNDFTPKKRRGYKWLNFCYRHLNVRIHHNWNRFENFIQEKIDFKNIKKKLVLGLGFRFSSVGFIKFKKLDSVVKVKSRPWSKFSTFFYFCSIFFFNIYTKLAFFSMIFLHFGPFLHIHAQMNLLVLSTEKNGTVEMAFSRNQLALLFLIISDPVSARTGKSLFILFERVPLFSKPLFP